MTDISLDVGATRRPTNNLGDYAELAAAFTRLVTGLPADSDTSGACSIVPSRSIRTRWANRLVRQKLYSELLELQKRGIPLPLPGLGPIPAIRPYNLPPDPAYGSRRRKGHGNSVTTATYAVTEASLPTQKVCVVGAGIAGLYIAMILDDLQIPNLEYDILEASDRVGGRVYTYRFSERENDYYDIGAMRYPDISTMQRTFDLFKRTGVRLLKYHLQGTHCPMLFNDRPFAAAARDPYGVSVSSGGTVPDDVVGNVEGILEDTFGPFKRALAEDFETGFGCLMAVDHFSTREYLKRGGANGLGRPLDFHSIQWLETQSTSTNLFDQAFSESVMDSCDFDGCGEEVEWYCVGGGTGKVIEAMKQRIHGRVETGKRVRKMALDQSSQAENNMTVHVAGEPEPRDGYLTVFNTTTLGCLSRMDTSGLDLHWAQKEAIRSLHYDESCKIALQFSYPWWIVDCGIREGGCSSTDLPLRTCVYPSYNLHDGDDKPAVLLASYTWAQDATRLGSMIANRTAQPAGSREQPPSEEELVELILQNLARLHAGNITYDKIKSSFTGTYHAWAWQNDPFSAGAFAMYGPGQFSNLYPYLTRPAADSKFHIVGEAASANHAWIVGSIDSAYSAVFKFLYRFGLWSHLQRLVERWGHVDEMEDGEHGTVHLQVALAGYVTSDYVDWEQLSAEIGVSVSLDFCGFEALFNDVVTQQQNESKRGEQSEFGLLGFGHAHASVSAYLASRGIAATTWALPHHFENGHHSNGHHTNGNHANGNHNAHYGNVPNNAQSLKEAASLQDMVTWHECLILAAPIDAQESYFVALEELNPLLQDTTLVVVDGSDSTPLSSGRLHTKHVIESHLFRPAPKLAHDKPALNGTGVSQEFESYRSKLSNGNSNNSTPSLSESVQSLLNDLNRLSAKVSQRGMSLEDGLGELLRYKDGLVESFAHVAEYENKDTPVVTMFSGGLDSTYLLLKLQQLGFTNVHAVAVDVGGFIDQDQLTKFAAHFGATFICLDGRELFVQQGVTSAIRAHAKYLGMYPISSSLSRPVIARLTADYAKSLNAGLLLHTANLSQNSLPRLNISLRHYGFSGKFGSPYVRSVVSRKQKALELSAVGLTFKSDRKLSGDENLWCREFETGPLDDPEAFDIPEDAYEWTAHSGHYAPEKLKLTFERGNLVAVNGDRLALAEAIALLNKEVGKFGHGRFVGLEAIRTDEKVLEVREAPAATIIMDALRHLEVASLESNALELKQSLEQKWVAEAIAGRWESSCHSMCDAAIASAVDGVGGSVTYRIDHMRYLPCSIVADTARYIRDRDQWEYKESLRQTFRS